MGDYKWEVPGSNLPPGTSDHMRGNDQCGM